MYRFRSRSLGQIVHSNSDPTGNFQHWVLGEWHVDHWLQEGSPGREITKNGILGKSMYTLGGDREFVRRELVLRSPEEAAHVHRESCPVSHAASSLIHTIVFHNHEEFKHRDSRKCQVSMPVRLHPPILLRSNPSCFQKYRPLLVRHLICRGTKMGPALILQVKGKSY